MNKFNLPRRNIQKERRQKRAERRKQRSAVKAPSSSSLVAAEKSSTALSLNVSAGAHSGYLSGKNRAKLTKKWRRAQKEALQSGLVTMHDIEMMAVDDEEGATTDEGVAQQQSVPKSKKKFSMKKRAKLRLRGAVPPAGEPVPSPAAGDDAMMQ